MTPATVRLDHAAASRLIPAEYARAALADLADTEAERDALDDLIGATDERLLGHADLLPGIDARELVYGVPCARLINDAFTHARPGGARFNSGDRGAWYAAFGLETAVAEVIWHHTRWLAEIDRFHDVSHRDEWVADFSGDWPDIRGDDRFAACLAADPAEGYAAGQALAARLLGAGEPGLVYPSVRGAGDCLACFRPPLVEQPRPGRRLVLTWDGDPVPTVAEA